jgi:hypothetical protein
VLPLASLPQHIYATWENNLPIKAGNPSTPVMYSTLDVPAFFIHFPNVHWDFPSYSILLVLLLQAMCFGISLPLPCPHEQVLGTISTSKFHDKSQALPCS